MTYYFLYYISTHPRETHFVYYEIHPKRTNAQDNPQNTTRRRFLLQFLTVAGAIACRSSGSARPGMKRRQDRRDDATDRMQERDDKMVERRDDPIGIRGPERREDGAISVKTVAMIGASESMKAREE